MDVMRTFNMLRINFNTPVPYNQRDKVIKGLKDMGLNYERIYQSGNYSLHRFFGRLPTMGDDDVYIHFIDDKSREELKAHGVANSVEIYLNIERKTL